MSAPTRWKDSPNAPIGMRELLGSAKRSRPMDEGSFVRGADKVAKIAIAPAAAAAISVWAKLAWAGAAIGLAAAGTVAVTHLTSSRPTEAIVVSATHAAATPAVVIAPSLPSAPAEEPPPPIADEPVVAPPPTKKIIVVAPPPPPPPPAAAPSASTAWVPEEPARPASTLKDELSLLETAKRDLARSPETSLSKLAEHRARYPSGVLSAERDLMELDALRRTGRTQDARARAQAWLARDPQGIHSARVRQILSTLE